MLSLPLFIAQELVAAPDAGSGFNWQILLSPAIVWVFIPITAILIGGISKILQQSQRHRERMAMIAAGIHPDDPEGGELDAADQNLRETAAYRSA
jgi:hypothetical protein